jgi:anthranilate synthase component 2
LILKILVLDNYDSFTYNLVHLVEKVTGLSIDVYRNDQISLPAVDIYDRIILSPGPGLPKDAGIMPELLNAYHHRKSIFGVCLGMQAIGEFYGGTLSNLKRVCHGQAIPLVHQQEGLFEHCPPQFLTGRYHSWVVNKDNLPQQLQITATDPDGHIMALKHTRDDVCGVQFHPESILSEYGEQIFKNWFSIK